MTGVPRGFVAVPKTNEILTADWQPRLSQEDRGCCIRVCVCVPGVQRACNGSVLWRNFEVESD